MLWTMKGSAEREKLVANAATQANTDWPDWLTDRPDLTWPDWLIDRRTDWLTWCVLTGHWTNELCELAPWSTGERRNRSNVSWTSVGIVLKLCCHSFGIVLASLWLVSGNVLELCRRGTEIIFVWQCFRMVLTLLVEWFCYFCWGPFWNCLGIALELAWYRLGIGLSSFWNYFGIALEWFSHGVGSDLVLIRNILALC